MSPPPLFPSHIRSFEATLGGPHHLHIGPDEGHRIAADPVTLEQVATKIVATHINLAR